MKESYCNRCHSACPDYDRQSILLCLPELLPDSQRGVCRSNNSLHVRLFLGKEKGNSNLEKESFRQCGQFREFKIKVKIRTAESGAYVGSAACNSIDYCVADLL